MSSFTYFSKIPCMYKNLIFLLDLKASEFTPLTKLLLQQSLENFCF